jgi:hypothetical protein
MKRSFHVCALGLTLACILPASAFCEECITLKTPEITDIVEGDRQVEVWWRDEYPESLTCVLEPRLGTAQSPWRGKATLASGGFYTGACDHPYRFTVSYSDSARLRWAEINWLTGAQRTRVVTISDTYVPYDLSDGITVTVLPESLFVVTDSLAWSPDNPVFHGIYMGGNGDFPDTPMVFTMVCAVGGSLDESGTAGVVVDWEDSTGSSGTIDVESSGVDYEIDQGLMVNFPAGGYEEGDSLFLDVYTPFVHNDIMTIEGSTFDGYQVLRRSVEDRPGTYKVVLDVSRCEEPDFFLPLDGERYFLDRGITDTGEGVTPDPDAPTVLDGFPYEYSVVTYDVLSDPATPGELITSTPDPIKVYPSQPVGNSVTGVYVVPNPYLFHAGWEETINGARRAKLQFVNVPYNAEIRIFDASGGYVQTVRPNLNLDGSQAGTADWNLRNSDGRDVASGVYIYRVEAGGQEKLGRFVVVR